MLFHVESRNESWLDVEDLCTRRYRERRIEGKHSRASETRYDYVAKQAWTTNYLTGNIKSLPLESPVQDMVSSLYYVRTQPLALNTNQSFPINVGATNYTVAFRPDVRKTMFFRPTGDIAALRIEPLARPCCPRCRFAAAIDDRRATGDGLRGTRGVRE